MPARDVGVSIPNFTFASPPPSGRLNGGLAARQARPGEGPPGPLAGRSAFLAGKPPARVGLPSAGTKYTPARDGKTRSRRLVTDRLSARPAGPWLRIGAPG